ncbi:MAG TPA: CsbD family protein [Cellvibrio sp.]|nr:CsbD family protein [Cellvibrio sp.]
MNKDQVKGSVKQAAGKVQQKTGEALGSEKHQAKGAAKQAEGKIQKGYGDLKDNHK